MTLTAKLPISVLVVFLVSLGLVLAPASRADSPPSAVGEVVTLPIPP